MLKTIKFAKFSLYVAPVLIIAGCSSTSTTQRPTPRPVPQQVPVPQYPVSPAPVQRPIGSQLPVPTVDVRPQTPPTVTQTPPVVLQPKTNYRSFNDWKSDFSMQAIGKGYSPQEVQSLLASAQLNSQVISLDSNQPEFAKMPWQYADSAVSTGRVNNGKQKFNEQQYLLNRLESQYGVSAEIIAAIWGMESSYGAGTGSSYIPSSLASLAYDGRRRAFAEEQLEALMQLARRGDVSLSTVDGSWAGGMGQTQFIPGTWLTQGVDGDGDGRRNPWSTADALSSTANYLSNSGWVRGLSPFYEVSLPASFNYGFLNTKQTANQWRAMGITPMDGAYLDANTLFELWLPAGKEGPALLLSPNFDVIKVYNNSSSYALGVSLLGRAIKGETGIRQAWPRYEKPLSTVQVRNLQQRLTTAGYDTKGVDGILGSNTKRAFAKWQADNGHIPDGFITQRSAASLVW